MRERSDVAIENYRPDFALEDEVAKPVVATDDSGFVGDGGIISPPAGPWLARAQDSRRNIVSSSARFGET
jgi:hypothetical protein